VFQTLLESLSNRWGSTETSPEQRERTFVPNPASWGLLFYRYRAFLQIVGHGWFPDRSCIETRSRLDQKGAGFATALMASEVSVMPTFAARRNVDAQRTVEHQHFSTTGSCSAESLLRPILQCATLLIIVRIANFRRVREFYIWSAVVGRYVSVWDAGPGWLFVVNIQRNVLCVFSSFLLYLDPNILAFQIRETSRCRVGCTMTELACSWFVWNLLGKML